MNGLPRKRRSGERPIGFEMGSFHFDAFFLAPTFIYLLVEFIEKLLDTGFRIAYMREAEAAHPPAV